MTQIELSDDEQELVERSHQRLLGMLQDHGNVVSSEHSEALRNLLWLMTAQSMGYMTGRYVAPLPTGSGKTTAIAAWLTELAHWSEQVSVCVSMFTVEALCRLYRTLLANGLSEDQVGIIHHSKELTEPLMPGELPPPGFATVPSLKWDEESRSYPGRQVILVTHQRLRDGKLDQFFFQEGEPRDLTIFDESLVTNRSVKIPARALHAASNALAGRVEQSDIAPLQRYLEPFSSWYQRVDRNDPTAIFEFPVVDNTQEKELLRIAETFNQTDINSPVQFTALTTAIRSSGESFRLFRYGAPVLVRPEQCFPDDVENVLVLDASFLCKIAERFDTSIKSGEHALTEARARPVHLLGIKQYENVVLKVLPVPSGRTSIENDLNLDKSKLAEVIAVVNSVPSQEAVLVFCFKNLGRPKFKDAELVELDFKNAGIDLEQTLETADGTRKRINILTWGQETGLNEFSHCQHVILYGLLRRDRVELATLYLGAANDLQADYGRDRMVVHDFAETAQTAFQALSRGSCRIMNDGQATSMTGYVMAQADGIVKNLLTLMPSAKVEPWNPIAPHSETERDREVSRIRQIMRQAFDDAFDSDQEMKISGTELSKRINAGSPSLPSSTRKRLIDEAMDGMFWIKQGRSYIELDLRNLGPVEFMDQSTDSNS